MSQNEIRSIIEATLKSGRKNPELFELPKILGVKSKLESCSLINDVICVLEDNRTLISQSFGLSDSSFNGGVEKLKALNQITV